MNKLNFVCKSIEVYKTSLLLAEWSIDKEKSKLLTVESCELISRFIKEYWGAQRKIFPKFLWEKEGREIMVTSKGKNYKKLNNTARVSSSPCKQNC